MSDLRYGVLHQYNKKTEELLLLLTSCDQKQPAFRKILDHLKTETFLIEEEYVDKDHLVDYSNFYARCHQEYKRFCLRIHFFRKSKINKKNFSFTNKVFSEIISSSNNSELFKQINEVYLGFIVLKEFKNNTTLIGKTCLAHYDELEVPKRRYNASRIYNISLYGIPLSVKTMAFHEQDQATGVCASIALWSALNVTGIKYQHAIPSPSEVTKLAISESSYSRLNEGLSAEQMAVGISKIGLNPVILKPKNDRELKSMIYAHLKAGVPIICGLSLYDEYLDGRVASNTKSFHAVTINGYTFKEGVEDIVFEGELKLYSNRVTKFYAHDDQLCPFAKMKFTGKYKYINNTPFQALSTSWLTDKPKERGLNKHKIANVITLVIPLDHKIRITYSDVMDQLEKINTEVKSMLKGFEIPNIFEWDLFLTDINTFKSDLLSVPVYPDKEKLIKESHAKYLWRAKAVFKNEVLFEIIFDATDTAKGGISKRGIYHSDIFKFIFEFITKKSKLI